jgi:transmembrane sensor
MKPNSDMTRREKTEDLLEAFIKGKITKEENNALFEIINKEKDQEHINAWFYEKWDQSPARKSASETAKAFHDLRSVLNVDPDLVKSFEHVNINIRTGINKIAFHFLRYAAVFLAAVIISYTAFYLYSRQKSSLEAHKYEISVPIGSKSEISLTDGTKIWLNSGSKLTYDDYSGAQTREVFLEGEAFFDVVENKNKPFIVRTTDIYIKVLGTKFNVRSYPDDNIIEATLVSGIIEIEEINPGKEQKMNITLRPNQKVTFTKKAHMAEAGKSPDKKLPAKPVEKISIIKKVDPEIITSWKDDKLIFNNEPFKSLLPKLERWYNVEIQLSDTSIYGYRYTGMFEKETVEQALNALKLATPFEYTIYKNKINIITTKNRNRK